MLILKLKSWSRQEKRLYELHQILLIVPSAVENFTSFIEFGEENGSIPNDAIFLSAFCV
jgi:hypothetical protein